MAQSHAVGLLARSATGSYAGERLLAMSFGSAGWGTILQDVFRRASMQISVIIPVYNAAAYVTQAVESALEQPETAEVLLIEDWLTG